MDFIKLEQIAKSLTSYEYDALVIELSDILESIPIDVRKIDNSSNAFGQDHGSQTNFLYTARLNSGNKKDPWGNVKKISYIPKDETHNILDFGRINKPGQSMFYCSTEWHTAIYELLPYGIKHDPKAVQEYWFTIGTWKLESDLLLADIPKSEKYLKILMDELPQLGIPQSDLVRAKKYNDQLRARIHSEEKFRILMYFADQFAKTNTHNRKEYMISNYYGDRVYGKIKGFDKPMSPIGDFSDLDGIIYPSVPSGYNDSNLLLEPAIVDSKLKFMWADRVLFRVLPDGSWDLRNGNQKEHVYEFGNIWWDLP